jgi:hypothetical protein
MQDRKSGSSFKVALTCSAPSDPRTRLGILAASTERFRKQNERMVLGLEVGFRTLEQQQGHNGKR